MWHNKFITIFIVLVSNYLMDNNKSQIELNSIWTAAVESEVYVHLLLLLIKLVDRWFVHCFALFWVNVLFETKRLKMKVKVTASRCRHRDANQRQCKRQKKIKRKIPSKCVTMMTMIFDHSIWIIDMRFAIYAL